MSNNTSQYFLPLFDHFAGTVLLYKVLFALIDAMAIFGNILVVLTIVLNPNMRSSIHCLLANLALSDLFFAILAPFDISTFVDRYNWKYGADFCRVYDFISRSFYAFSVLNLVLITIERFLATRYPLSFRGNSRRTLALVLGTWVLSFLFSCPFLFVMKYERITPNHSLCLQSWPTMMAQRGYYLSVYVILYFIPLALVIFMYAQICMTLRKQPPGSLVDTNDSQRKQFKARKRMSRVVIVIVVAFFVCWTPWNVTECLWIFSDVPWKNPKIFPVVASYSLLAVYLSTAVNPVLLCFMSSEFRTGFHFVFVRISLWYRLCRRSSD